MSEFVLQKEAFFSLTTQEVRGTTKFDYLRKRADLGGKQAISYSLLLEAYKVSEAETATSN